jgi:hypothetical protein
MILGRAVQITGATSGLNFFQSLERLTAKIFGRPPLLRRNYPEWVVGAAADGQASIC